MKSTLNRIVAGQYAKTTVALTFAATMLMTVALPARGAAGSGLTWTADAETGRLTARRAEEKTEWRGEAMAEIGYWDGAGQERSKMLTPGEGWKITRRVTERGCRLVCRQDELGFSVALEFAPKGDVLTVGARAADVAETGAARLKTLRLLPRFGAAG
jgi:hypothetical protein